jgi:FAD-dependent urate hydroxylase
VRIVIAGAGIAGLALAGGLQRGGHDVTVLEESGGLRTGGAAIAVWNNGGMALRRLGTDLQPHGRVIDALELRSSKGKVVGRIDAARLSRNFGIDAVTIPRGEILQLLADQLIPDTVRFDSACVRVKDGADCAQVELANGESVEGDLVVGADGHRSAVRSLLTTELVATATGWASLQGLTPAPLDITRGTTSAYVAGQAGAVGLMPAGNGLLQWWFDVPWPPPANPPSVLTWLRRRFARWGAPVRDLLDVIDDSEIEPYPHIWHRVPKVLHANRVVLIGDAAHAIPPVLAQGANQSIEDAWVLSRELDQVAATVPAALARYDQERRTKVAIVSRVARAPMVQVYGLAGVGPQGRPLIPERFCTWSWDKVMRSCSSTVPRTMRSR